MTNHWPLYLTTFLTAGILLSGCIEPPEDDGDEDNTMNASTQAVYDWGVIDCEAVISVFPVQAEALAPHLPEGFTPLTPEEFGLPPDPRGDALIGIKALECDAGQGIYNTGGSVQYASSYSPVHPPEELEQDVDFHFVAWDTLSQNATAREIMQGQGLPIVDGESDLTGFTETPAGFAFDVGLRLGDDEYRFVGTALAPDEEFSKGFRYADFMAGDDGLTMWWADYTSPNIHAGAGILELAEGSLLAEVAGTTTTDALFLAAEDVSFRDGNVTLPF